MIETTLGTGWFFCRLTMKIAISTLVLIVTFLFVIGVPFQYEKESFSVIESDSSNIYISIDPTTKKTFLGMSVVKSSPYKITIFCFDKNCFPDISKLVIQVDNSEKELKVTAPVTTEGGVSVISPPILLNHDFDDGEGFKVFAKIGDNTLKSDKISWDMRFYSSQGISFFPLWTYFTH